MTLRDDAKTLREVQMRMSRMLAVATMLSAAGIALLLAGGTLVQFAILASAGSAMLVLFMRFESTAVSRAWEAGLRLATRDDVTDLPSAPFADHFVATEFAAAERGRDVTIVLLGFDEFDEFTRTHGPAAADGAIRRFSMTLKKLTRRMNLTARYGWRADTFLSVLSDADAAGAEVFVQRVRNALIEETDSTPLPAISAGIVEFDPSFRTPDEFVQQAERVLLDARAEGGNETVVRRSLVRCHSETGWLQAL